MIKTCLFNSSIYIMHVYGVLCTNFKPVKNLLDILPFIHKIITEPDVFENET